MEQLGALGIGIAALAITLVVTFLILSQAKTAETSTIPITTLSNSSFTFVNGTQSSIDSCVEFTCNNLYNDSIQTVEITTGNYTCSSTGTITPTIINFVRPGSTLYLNSTCKRTSLGLNSTGTMQNATQTIPGWIPLIVIAVIGGILLSLVAVFRRN